MKNKLFILVLVVVGLVLISGNVVADDQEWNMYVDEMREEELQNYEAMLPFAENSSVTFRSGANLGTIKHSLENASINSENQIKKLFATGQIDGKLDLGGPIKEINVETEQLISSYEADFISKYEDSNTDTDDTFTNENDDYSRFDFNIVMNKENSNNLNKYYYGVGLENESKSFVFDDNSSIEGYTIDKNRPYLMKKGYTVGGSHPGVIDREWQLSYIDTENTVKVNDKEFTTELQGLGFKFDVDGRYQATDNLVVGVGYTFRYDYMISKEDNSGDELAEELNFNNNDNLEETLTESSHYLYLSATLAF